MKTGLGSVALMYAQQNEKLRAALQRLVDIHFGADDSEAAAWDEAMEALEFVCSDEETEEGKTK